MKKQIDIGSRNTQISDDDTTTQIQIGFNKIWLVVALIGIIGFGLLKYGVEPWAIETLCRELVKCD